MLFNKTYILLLPLFLVSTLSSCEKRLIQEEPIDTLINPMDLLEEVKEETSDDVIDNVIDNVIDDVIDDAAEEAVEEVVEEVVEESKEDITLEDQPLIPAPNEEIVELESLNKKAFNLSSENKALEKKIRALTQEYNELKKALLDKINKTRELQSKDE